MIDDGKHAYYACPVAAAPAEEVLPELEEQEEVLGLGEIEEIPDEVEKSESRNDKLKKDANSLLHQMTHMPQNPFCATCRAAKLRKASARKIKIEDKRIAKVFGERVHADHVFPKDLKDDTERDESTCALALKDDSTEFRGFYPQTRKSAEESAASIRHFIGPKNKLTTLRTKN